jgi:hypothetical protein
VRRFALLLGAALAVAALSVAGCGVAALETLPAAYPEPPTASVAGFDPAATGVTGTAALPTAPADRLPGEPDPRLTPGALNPAVTQATIHSTICVSGWTATVRPAREYTDALKVRQIAEYGYSDTRTSQYEEDHLVPLSLGGATSDPRNLWPEPHDVKLADGRQVGSDVKNEYIGELNVAVCQGRISLAVARAGVIGWVHHWLAWNATPNAPTPTMAYYYCWDLGSPKPHHLGYRSTGDHPCSDEELRAAGFLH